DVLELNEQFDVIRHVYHIREDLLKPEEIAYVYVLASGTLCLGTEPLNRRDRHVLINPQTGRYIDLVAGIKTNSPIASVYTDREGSIWLCTDGDGLYHVFDSRFQIIGNDVLTVNPNVSDVAYDSLQKRIVIGTKKGVFALNYPLEQGSKFEVLAKNYFTNRLFPVTDGIGFCGKGIPGTRSHTYSKGQVRELPYYEILTTPGYLIEVSYGYGYRIYSRTKKTYYSQKKEENLPNSLIDISEDDQGRLWVASEKELFLFDWNDGWKEIHAWKGAMIYSLLFEKGRGLWVGSANGLYLISENGVLEQWTEKEGLHNSHINCLYLQKGKGLWIGTQNGLYLLDRNNELSLFKKRNGLIADDVSSFAALPDGYLGIGSSKGLTLLYPEAPSYRQEHPRLLLDEIRIDGLLSDWETADFEVDYNGTFEMNVNAITFLYPELLLFEYRLNPSDPWISTKNRSILLTRLESGTYHITLRVRKLDAGYSEPVTLTLRVLRPWWKTGYFYATIALLILGTTAYILYSRLEKQRKAFRLKKELADLKLKSVLTQLNPHFVSNSLNAIQYYILNRDERQANLYLSKFASLTRLILESSRHRFIPLRSEIEILEVYLSLEKLRFESRFDFSIHVDEVLSSKTHYLPGIIVQPFAENSIKHGLLYLSQATKGELAIYFLSEGDHLLIRIDDNGIGRKKSEEIKQKQGQKRTSLGGSIVEEIRQSVNELPGCSMEVAIIDKENEQGKSLGTLVEIRLKISVLVAEEEHFTPTEKKLI
ncbi:MAG: sensor histidine kinase, partial [Bacteroidia bacterium]